MATNKKPKELPEKKSTEIAVIAHDGKVQLRAEMILARVMQWKYRVMELSEVRPIPGNPRKWTKSQLGSLKAGILLQGLWQPAVVNLTTMHVVSGNMRFEALKALGVKRAPFIVGEMAIDEEQVLCAHANNRRAQGRWKREEAREWVKAIEKRSQSVAVQLALHGIVEEIQGEQALEEEGKTRVEFDAKKKGKKDKWAELQVVLPPGVLKIVHQKLDEIAVILGHGEKEAPVARGLALEVVFSDLEPEHYKEGEQVPAGGTA